MLGGHGRELGSQGPCRCGGSSFVVVLELLVAVKGLILSSCDGGHSSTISSIVIIVLSILEKYYNLELL